MQYHVISALLWFGHRYEATGRVPQTITAVLILHDIARLTSILLLLCNFSTLSIFARDLKITLYLDGTTLILPLGCTNKTWTLGGSVHAFCQNEEVAVSVQLLWNVTVGYISEITACNRVILTAFVNTTARLDLHLRSVKAILTSKWDCIVGLLNQEAHTAIGGGISSVVISR